jgi:replicative DNA helicase
MNQQRTKQAPRLMLPATAGDIGKLPPQAVELEEAVLGALMLERDTLDITIEILVADAFYKEAHGYIYQSIRSLHSRNEPVDILTVTQQLKRDGKLELVGGAYYISQLTNRVASGANVEFHARIIAQKYLQRELIRISSETIRDAYEDTSDVFELADEAMGNMLTVVDSNTRSSKAIRSVGDYAAESVKQLEIRTSRPDGLTGVPTGIKLLDLTIGGWQRSDLIIIAARPGMGKTAFVLGAAKHASSNGYPAGFLSLEMPGIQLADRLIVELSGVDAKLYKRGRLGNGEMEEVRRAAQYLNEVQLFIDETPSLSILEIRARARRLIRERQIELLIVDYLQLAQGDESKGRQGNREQEIASISRGLKSIAKELGIPVIALSQLSRQVEARGGDKRPQLSDLRESGTLEQDADIVMFIHRPEYYGFMTDEQGKSTIGLAELIIAKHRNGDVGTIDVNFDSNYTRFRDIELPKPSIKPSTDWSTSQSELDDRNDMPF